jgi:hypothetical protein
MCEEDERFPPIPPDIEPDGFRTPPPGNAALDPGPWHHCPIKCCHYPHKAAGGSVEMKDADAIRFSFSAVNMDRVALEKAFGDAEEILEMPTYVPWILHAPESPAETPGLLYPNFISRFEILSLYSLASDVPLIQFTPYALSDRFGSRLGAPKDRILADFKRRLDRIAFYEEGDAECGNGTDRKTVAQLFEKTLPFDVIGGCLDEDDKTHPATTDDAFAHYRYALATERTASLDYVTGRGYAVLAAGALPIYRGPEQDWTEHVRHFFPRESVIPLESFPNPLDLRAYLKRLSRDDAELWKLLKWKARRKLDGGPRILWEVGKYSLECRMCLKALEYREKNNRTEPRIFQ